jgi:osmotically-inducible protein OsmY
MTNDIVLRQAILNELRWDSRTDATHVNVTVDDGTVTLTGHVSSFPSIFLVREAVRRVNGVKVIADDLTLHLPSSHARDDTDIAHSIVHVLDCNVSGPEATVQAEVSHGHVILTGTVDWQHQREHVENQVAHVRGVRGISNQINLTLRPTPDNVKSQIEEALTRNAELEAKHITVTVNDDEVILEGRVKAFYERNLVEAAAWHAPGVRRVVDKINVG